MVPGHWLLFARRRSLGTRQQTALDTMAVDTACVPERRVLSAACKSGDTAEDTVEDIVVGIAADSQRPPVDRRMRTGGMRRSPCTAAEGAARSRGTQGNRSFCGSTV